MISLDTECTGLDLRHGARPYLVTTCDVRGVNTWWEWLVDPLTRKPRVRKRDLRQIQTTIDEADLLVLQNPKYDVLALTLAFRDAGLPLRWDWRKVRCTLLAGHLLASNHSHELTSMVLEHLGVDVQPYDDRVRAATEECRRIAKRDHLDWRLAKQGLPEMPSAKKKVWKSDMWLPRLLAKEASKPKWKTVTAEYANSDSSSTLVLWQKQEQLLKKRKLWAIYLERLQVLPVVEKMENRGVTVNKKRFAKLTEEYREESDRAGRVCINVAKSCGYELKLPKSGNNGSLLDFVFGSKCEKCEGTGYKDLGPGLKASCDQCHGKGRFGGLGLHWVKTSKKTGEPSLDSWTLDEYEAILPKRGKALKFVQALKAKRKRDTALSYMEGYERFWLPLDVDENEAGWYVLHPSLNPTGSTTLRWSSSNPSEQNISKQKGFNLRYGFGPSPGREWWSLDAKNIELRIPAYEAGEAEMIELFERPDDPPYFGSYHLLIFDTLHPKMFAKHGAAAKDDFDSTWYQWIKNGNFAVQYGSIEQSGTADRAYHVPGAFAGIKKRFKKIHGPGGLNDQMIERANRMGYVETIPDKNVDPDRGYPLLCSHGFFHGKVKPTIPLSYHVQSTACWWMTKAMVRVQGYLDKLNTKDNRGYYMVMQVHDEAVLDFPAGRKLTGEKGPQYENLQKIREVQRLMEQGGEDIGVPTPVSIEYHAETWSEGVAV